MWFYYRALVHCLKNLYVRLWLSVIIACIHWVANTYLKFVLEITSWVIMTIWTMVLGLQGYIQLLAKLFILKHFQTLEKKKTLGQAKVIIWFTEFVGRNGRRKDKVWKYRFLPIIRYIYHSRGQFYQLFLKWEVRLHYFIPNSPNHSRMIFKPSN